MRLLRILGAGPLPPLPVRQAGVSERRELHSHEIDDDASSVTPPRPERMVARATLPPPAYVPSLHAGILGPICCRQWGPRVRLAAARNAFAYVFRPRMMRSTGTSWHAPSSAVEPSFRCWLSALPTMLSAASEDGLTIGVIRPKTRSCLSPQAVRGCRSAAIVFPMLHQQRGPFDPHLPDRDQNLRRQYRPAHPNPRITRNHNPANNGSHGAAASVGIPHSPATARLDYGFAGAKAAAASTGADAN
jgi:hypothetical protein